MHADGQRVSDCAVHDPRRDQDHSRTCTLRIEDNSAIRLVAYTGPV